MKRFGIAVLLLALLASASFADTSVFYPMRIDVVKVLAHADGFRVIYRHGANGIADVYLPSSWFVPGGKAELVRADDPSYPYMTIFYKEGKFDHLRLYVKADSKDQTWGVLSPGEGVGKFKDEDPKIQF
jgi:hypothetical protein